MHGQMDALPIVEDTLRDLLAILFGFAHLNRVDLDAEKRMLKLRTAQQSIGEEQRDLRRIPRRSDLTLQQLPPYVRRSTRDHLTSWS